LKNLLAWRGGFEPTTIDLNSQSGAYDLSAMTKPFENVVTVNLEPIYKHFISNQQVYSELEAIIDKLAKDVQKGTLPKRMLPKPQPLPIANMPTIHSNSMSNL